MAPGRPLQRARCHSRQDAACEGIWLADQPEAHRPGAELQGVSAIAHAFCAFPILPGKRGAARTFLIELEGVRKEHSACSERRLGLIKEVWAVQQAPQGDLVVVFITGEAISNAFQQFATAHDVFDQ
jgi:hypothetical protein